jgi:hypothetical protein
MKPGLMLELVAVDGEIQLLREATLQRSQVLQEIRSYLFEVVGFGLRLNGDDAFEAVTLRYDFSTLSKDQKLRNYYFDVIVWNRQWLDSAQELEGRLERVNQMLDRTQ